MAKTATVKLTPDEIRQWDDLYQYVRKEILQYDDNQSIPRELVLRLKGLAQGKQMANNNVGNCANYSFEIILMTFKLCKSKIFSAIHGKIFSSEISKFLYISKIIESNINDVYMRVDTARKSQEKLKSIKVDNISHEGATYVPKTENINNKLSNLW